MRELRDILSKGWAVIKAADKDLTASVFNALDERFSLSCAKQDENRLAVYNHETAPKNSMSAIIGNGQQPPHTDRAFEQYPPRFLLLECIDPGPNPCPTYVWSFDVQRILHERRQELFDDAWTFGPPTGRRFYSTIINGRTATDFTIRFDPICMRRTGNIIEDPITILQELATENMITLSAGDSLIISNWQALHFRGNAEVSQGRIFKRYYWRQHGLGTRASFAKSQAVRPTGPR